MSLEDLVDSVLSDAIVCDLGGPLLCASPGSLSGAFHHLGSFEPNKTKQYVFTRFIHEERVERGKNILLLKEGCRYTFKLAYRCLGIPEQSDSISSLQLVFLDGFGSADPKSIDINTEYNVIDVVLSVPIVDSEKTTSFRLLASEGDIARVAGESVKLKIKKSTKNQVLGFTWLIVFGASSAFLSSNTFSDNPFISWGGMLRVFAVLLQVLALVAVAYRLGRRLDR